MGAKIIYRPEFRGKITGAVTPVMKEISLYLQSSANRKIASGVAPANSPLTKRVKGGDKTLRDNGQLAASIAPHSGDTWAAAGTNLRYAKILQTGGAVRSKGKGLWLPASARTRQLYRQYGQTTPRGLIKAMKDDGYSCFFTPLSKVYCAVKGKRGKPFALFIVRSQVIIPARPFLHVDEKDEKYIVSLIQKSVLHSLEPGK